MSHFICIVIGDDPDKQLQSFHEFECTGQDDQYVVDVDITDQARKEYESETTKLVVNEVTGEEFDAHDDQCYREPTAEEAKAIGPLAGYGGAPGGDGVYWASKDWGDGRGYRAKVHHVPEGFTLKVVRTKDRFTFVRWVKEHYGYEPLFLGEPRGPQNKYGFVEIDNTSADARVRVVDRTNPNKKWDWWALGGRWTGYFPLKPNAVEFDIGKPGLGTTVAQDGYADSCRRGDIDVERARNDAEKKADELFSKWEACFLEHGKPRAWSEFMAQIHAGTLKIGEARTAYHGQPAIRESYKTLWDCPVDAMGFDRAAFIQRRRNQALVPFAVLKDGKWYERGEMGWWGVVHDEKDADEWCRQFSQLLDDLPPDVLMTAIDCHI